MYPSRPGDDAARGRPVGGPGDQAGLPGCADAARSPAAVGAVARSRGSSPHSRPAPGSRTHRWRTPSRTPPRGTAPCATPRLWPSPLPTATPAQREEATWRDGGDQPTGVGGRRRASRCAAITHTRIPTPARSQAIRTLWARSCLCENLGARGRGVRPRRPAQTVPGRTIVRARPTRPARVTRSCASPTRRAPARARPRCVRAWSRRYQPSEARPSTPLEVPPNIGLSRRCASTPSSTFRLSRSSTPRP